MSQSRSDREKLYQKKADGGEKLRYFYAVRKVSRANDNWPAYQVEMLAAQDGKIVKQELLGKPDMLVMVLAILNELTDPSNAPESEDATNTISA